MLRSLNWPPVAVGLLAAQTVALLLLVLRLLPGRKRKPPVAPSTSEITDTTVSVIVATLNEADRIGPCLAGLRAQGAPLLEVLVVDSRSTDGTRELVQCAAASDPRVQLLTDDPLPDGWVGKPWALEHGLRAARGEWLLGIDADTEPNPGLVAAVVQTARDGRYDLVSFSPRFAGQTAAERLVQPALLRTLIYRAGAVGTESDPERVLANGQCFLVKRSLLAEHGGYAVSRASFADDVTLARHLARRGACVGFMDGSRLYRVRAYRDVGDMWRGWGRSLDLSNATSWWRQAVDVLYLIAAQGLPLPLVCGLGVLMTNNPSFVVRALFGVDAVLVGIHIAMLFALAGSYERRGVTFWLSWLADPVAALRILISSVNRRRTWRGRDYGRLALMSTAHE